ncbi:unnamed protein product [Protopolystoma xenopodis]|uniref:Uncharacterized protein n=1 Tax=Protopolystoma xenopodis TaxID=117903 RepID=A0A448XMC7_9PLAT|nr:unnamed protein product [Protopolystoma xenopodis]
MSGRAVGRTAGRLVGWSGGQIVCWLIPQAVGGSLELHLKPNSTQTTLNGREGSAGMCTPRDSLPSCNGGDGLLDAVHRKCDKSMRSTLQNLSPVPTCRTSRQTTNSPLDPLVHLLETAPSTLLSPSPLVTTSPSRRHRYLR